MFLDQIVATKRAEVEQLKEQFSLLKAERQIAELPICRGFVEALSHARRHRSMGLIAEVKKASPSKGLIRPDFNPAGLAEAYESAGADCISVLTDRDYFQGSNDYLSSIRAHIQAPILRKDFTIDYRQIYEARLIGADAILLIAAILTGVQMREFIETAKAIGLDVLVEVHNMVELDTVLTLGDSKLIGINNRNLQTFATDLQTTEELIRHIPQGIVVVSESGISNPAEINRLQSVGVQAVLVGEHFMRQSDVSKAVYDLLGVPDFDGVSIDGVGSNGVGSNG